MGITQKSAVVEQVLLQLPNFQKHVDNALLMLTPQQLNNIKNNIRDGILSGNIDYSKDRSNTAEVQSYARSMTMNHLKKAVELNGNTKNKVVAKLSDTTHPNDSNRNIRVSLVKVKPIAPKGVKVDLLTDDLKDYVKNLV